jgi:hypothetical protein
LARKAAWTVGCALLLSMSQPVVVMAGNAELLLSCRHAPDDQILALVCDRVEREAATIASAAGYGVTIIRGKATLPPVPVAETRALDIQVTGTRPESPFGTKKVTALVTGTYAPPAAGHWESELTAKGAPRDLLHPVADALLARLEAFLATSPTE